MGLFVITAPSGAGKTSLAGEIAKARVWVECLSHTTRGIRIHDGEVDGKTYNYVSEEEFVEMASNNEFVEYVQYDGNFYGMTKVEIESVLSKNEHAYIIVEYNGYKQIKKEYPDAIGIFLHMSKEDCMANMLIRGDKIESATKRIEKYDEEMKNRGDYDYVVKNVRGKKSETITILRYIITQNATVKEYALFR